MQISNDIIPELVIPEQYKKNWIEYFESLIDSMPKENVEKLVSEWAEEYRVISISSQPGPFSYDVTPYLREIADCLSSSSPVTEVVFMKSTQIGATVGILENFIGYCIYYGIGPLLYVSGDQQMAEDSMATRIDELISNSDLSDRIKPVVVKKNNRSSGDRRDLKSYAGTFLRAAGPNSESKLRSFPALGNLIDEIDVYKQTIVKNGSSTGNPIEKILRRADSFGNQKKVLYISTPKEEATSQIEPLYEQGDKREYRVPCPKCGHKQKLVWSNLEWEKDKNGKLNVEYIEIDGNPIIANDPVWYNCSAEGCDYKIRNHEKDFFLAEKGHGGEAEWIATKKPDRPGLRSYHVNALYSPIGFRDWVDLVIHFERVKHDPLLLPDFINDVLGETSKINQEKPDIHVLMQYAENWHRGDINERVLFLTLAVDVQQDRLECGLMGWGRQKQAWMIDYWTFEGDVKEDGGGPWMRLHDLIGQEYVRSDGLVMNISMTFIDKSYLGSIVESFCDQYEYFPGTAKGVFPVEGRETASRLVTKIKNNYLTPVVMIDDQKAKKTIYQNLNKKPGADNQYPYGYIHFSEDYGEEFYKQLTAEEFIPDVNKKTGKKKILIGNPKRRRNEVLDIVKYNYTAFEYAMADYFEELNRDKKLQKLNPVEPNIDYFFDTCEAAYS